MPSQQMVVSHVRHPRRRILIGSAHLNRRTGVLPLQGSRNLHSYVLGGLGILLEGTFVRSSSWVERGGLDTGYIIAIENGCCICMGFKT
jgi:hypothetical protein